MKKSKKNLKGMTLIEIIVSMAIFAVMAGVLLTIGQVVDNTTRNATNLKTKVNTEAPMAASNQHTFTDPDDPTQDIDLGSTNFDIHVQINESGTYYDGNGVAQNYSNPSEDVPAIKYDTEDYYKSKLTDTQKALYPDSPNSNLNLEFVVLQ